MVTLGRINTLTILRSTSVGLFLGDDDIDDLLLPNKYVPESYEIGDSIDVFCYLDHEERPVATTQTPLIKRGEFAYLEVVDVNEFGAFLDWGLEKHLFAPFREQQQKMETGQRYVVHCYLDEKSFRLAASSKLRKFFSKEIPDYNINQKVEALVIRISDIGVDMVVEQQFRGLVFRDQVFRDLAVGDRVTAYIKEVRPDGKIDLSLQAVGTEKLEPAAEEVWETLMANKGFLPLHDKSSPEQIKSELQMSKKTFKKAIGVLYRKRKIRIEETGIYAVQKGGSS